MSDHRKRCCCVPCLEKAGTPLVRLPDTPAADERTLLETFGFLVRLRPEAPGFPLGFVAHTEGLVRSRGHAELEVVCPLPHDRIRDLFVAAVDLIDQGVTFYPGRVFPGVLESGFDVACAWSREGAAKRLRFILPDGHNHLRASLMAGRLARQWRGTQEQ